jgi:hypothetical protein
MYGIKIEKYLAATTRLTDAGQYILGFQEDDQIVVYQAYNDQIADYAIKHQCFGGDNYSYNRMSWIKPNFLWMMYRSGWASKENQNRVLAIWINKADFEKILEKAVFSSFDPIYYTTRDEWKKQLNEKEVRLQWDPDHDPFGNKLTRRAIQIGMKGYALEEFGKHFIKKIEDVTHFVTEQKIHVDNKNLDELFVPVETIYNIIDAGLSKQIGVTES